LLDTDWRQYEQYHYVETIAKIYLLLIWVSQILRRALFALSYNSRYAHKILLCSDRQFFPYAK